MHFSYQFTYQNGRSREKVCNVLPCAFYFMVDIFQFCVIWCWKRSNKCVLAVAIWTNYQWKKLEESRSHSHVGSCWIYQLKLTGMWCLSCLEDWKEEKRNRWLNRVCLLPMGRAIMMMVQPHTQGLSFPWPAVRKRATLERSNLKFQNIVLRFESHMPGFHMNDQRTSWNSFALFLKPIKVNPVTEL